MDLRELAKEAAEKEIQDFCCMNREFGKHVLHALETAAGERQKENQRLTDGYATVRQVNMDLEFQLTDLRAQLAVAVEVRRIADERLLATEKELASNAILRESSKKVADGVWKTHQQQFDEQQATIDQLKLALEQARKDGERMDWLDKNNPYCWASTYQGQTYRSMVDAAITKGRTMVGAKYNTTRQAGQKEL